ncbi:MAG: molybdopterin molybdotransferase MoeA [Candidatus Baltobacteraceae bacterium]
MRVSNALLPNGGFATEKLLAPERALVAFFSRANVIRPQIEQVGLDVCVGRILAQPVHADADYPAAPRSTMDGFAILSADAPGSLKIGGEVAMGSVWDRRLERGSALKIATGGLLPAGSDAVVPVEDARVSGEMVVVSTAIPAGDCVNPIGSDMRSGEQMLGPGRRIGAAEVGLLATLGIVKVPVFRIPVFGLLSSGDELVPPADQPALGQIRDSNRYAIAAGLRAMGAYARHFPTVSDEPGALEGMLREALETCDGVILTGGSSVGERDRTPGAIASLGSPGVLVHGLRVKPGKPTVFGAIDGKPILGLPGNPVSALLILQAVAAPIVDALTGLRPSEPRIVCAIAAEPIRGRVGWTWFVPVQLERTGERYSARPLPLRSANVSLLARASGFVTMGENEELVAAGAALWVHQFSAGGL